MNAYEARLTVARRAFQAGAPSEVEVEAGVRRVMQSLSRTRRRDPARRIVTLGATALAFSAALAWGASGGFDMRPAGSASGKRAPELHNGVEQLRPARKQAVRTLRERVPLSSDDLPPISEQLPDSKAAPVKGAEATPGAATVGGAAGTQQSGSTVSSSSETSPARPSTSNAKSSALRGIDGTAARPGAAAPSWSEVGDALERGDDDGARRALKDLASRSDEPNTRAKAQLGLAQLAIAKGDCRKARALAKSVARTPGLAEKVVARAHDLMLRCESE